MKQFLMYGMAAAVAALIVSSTLAIVTNTEKVAMAPRHYSAIENRHVAALAALPPGEDEYLIDTVDVLTFEEEKDIRTSLEALANSMGVEMTVFMVPTFDPTSPDEYSDIIAEVWEYNYTNENWVLLAIGVDDGEIRYDTGSRLASNLTPEKMGAIISTRVQPFVNNGEWYNAINEGVLAIAGQTSRQ